MLETKRINSSTKQGKVRQIIKKTTRKIAWTKKKRRQWECFTKAANTSGIQGVNAI